MMHRLEQLLYGYSKRKSRRHLYPWLAETLAGLSLDREQLVLNIGAGGEVADAIAACGLRVLSVDADPARRPDIVATMENMAAVGTASCQVVVCAEVLEHVARPEKAIAEVLRVLKPGGVLIGSTPFLLGVHDAPLDYRRFTVYGLEQLLDGFIEVKIRARNTYFAAISVLLSRRFVIGDARQRRTAAWLSPVLLLLCATLDALDRCWPFTDGTTGYFFVGRKPAA